ncbi:TLC domain-containing protein 4-like [Rana temporaria]|uniref:TLC domain-containing protein 4-like n=1 Tax=Rana temporaria TaxID=8407 RepID=UPI001AAD1861|nr:TLC domain-containing protein 4-like [Rana temporaria]
MVDSVLLSYCVVTGSFLFFQLLFSVISPTFSSRCCSTYNQLTRAKQCEWDSRVVSTVHALIVGSFCLYILAYDDAVNLDPIWCIFTFGDLGISFLHYRWFFDAVGLPRSSRPVLINGLAMAVVFFIVRIAVIPSYYSQVFATFGTEGYIKLGTGPQVAWIVSCVILDILNVYWMYKIAAGFYRVVTKAKPGGKPKRNHAD